ncbi:TadE/TadG family type IV pilus assembly protein [Seohaeicola zhoushanensis]|uniref:Putative Flp pilus-assembly TadG-like N-terminal domain-containing protein n=1 Tax=Seohaeicola zhoushanensis TaxID=1569283 RepID=A0A8J3H0J2_9RHOB|nr:TadE/TadG family type IV pilus assembly protein [Seohaeicola zhoushanensis]GHF68277.1 hypothetical protein GCM10017056_44260 [Seohaeicola zhoushanensis]
MRVQQGKKATRSFGLALESGRFDKGALRRFGKDEDGSLLIFGVYIFVLILMIGGIGIDLMRFERDRAELQYTLDRAVLAAADMEQQLDPQAVVQDYFDKADLGGYLGGVAVTEGTGFRRVSANAESNVLTQFMHMTGVDTLRAPAIGTAEESIDNLEISMVLDISGSMNTGTRLEDLKVATHNFINSVFSNGNSDEISMSIVPFATQVNVGKSLLDKYTTTQEHQYSHCVDFVADEFKKTDLSRVVEMDRTAHFDPFTSTTNPIEIPVCPVRSNSAIVPLSNKPADLHAYVDDMTAQGNTSIDIGMKWGTVLLDPSTRSVVSDLIADGIVDPAFEGRPNDYNSGRILKVIVLMSDGENTNQYMLNPSLREGISDVWYNAEANKYTVYKSNGNPNYWWPHIRAFKDHPYGNELPGQPAETGTAVRLTYPELFNRVSLLWNVYNNYTYNGNSYGDWYQAAFSFLNGTAKDQFTKQMCGAAKDEGIIIFAVSLEAPKRGVRVLKDCASSDAHFFDVESNEINDAFNAIATSIRKLRLTQ